MIPRILLALSVFLAVEARAQDVAGSIGGRVLDASGAAVAGAEVTALHAGASTVRAAKTDAEGAFVFPALPIGRYEISVVSPGFKKLVRGGVELHLGDHLGLPLTMEVGDLTQEVSVVADAPQVQTESSEQSGLISGDQVRELQLNGRSFMTLIELLPGVASDMPDRADPNTNPTMSINGARSSASSFNIDGGNNADLIVGSSALNTFTSVDTIAEVKVMTSTFAAEYGRGGFSQVNVVTRGGTRSFHGSLYEFFRNDALDAKDYFSHQTLPLKLNNFGYTAGGPLLLGGYNRGRKKTFFFFTQEFNHVSTRGAAVTTTVPRPEERRGDFSGRGAGRDGVFGTADDPILDPLTGRGFPGGLIPPERIDQNAIKLLGLYPDPNATGPGAVNYVSAVAGLQRWRQELIRMDHNFPANWKVFGRYAQDTAFVKNPYGGSSYASITTRFPGIAATQSDRPGKNLVVNLTGVLTPAALNEFSATYAARGFEMLATNTAVTRASLGLTIPEIFAENDQNIIPQITLGSGLAALNIPRKGRKQLYNVEVSDNFTWIRGAHVLKFGGYYTTGGNWEQQFSPNTAGSFTFTTAGAGNPVANMLIGMPFSYSETERTLVSHLRYSMIEAFAQDDFKVTPRFTVNYGLRYSTYFNPHDRDDVLTNFIPGFFDPAKAPRINASNGLPAPGGDPLNGIIVAGRNSPWGRRISENNAHLLGPRLGFAWSPFRAAKTSIRGGYGIYYTRPLLGTFIQNAFANPPFGRSVTIQQPRLSSPGGGAEAAASAPSLTIVGTPVLAPTIQQWSFGVQREVFRHAVLSVAYVASRGTHLFRPVNLNNPPPGSSATGRPHINTVRPYLGYGSITLRESSAASTYHSMQVSFNRRMSRHLSVGTAYTWGKSIDDASSDRDAGDIPPDSTNKRAERGPSSLDRTQIFTANYIWHLPSPAPGPGGWGLLLNGWQFSGITRMWAGRPFDVTLSQDVALVGSAQNQRPNVIAGTDGPRTPQQWFNRDAFARPASGTFGDMGRNSLRGPGVHKWDLSLFKNFNVGERQRLQFRSEFFNAFNHPSFSNPGSNLQTTATGVNPNANSFGVITDTRDARVLQFGLKLTF